MAQLTGINKQQFLQQTYATSLQQVNALVNQYNEHIKKLLMPPNKTFLGLIGGGMGVVYSVIHGALSLVPNVLASLAYTLTNFSNDAAHIFTEEDETNAITDIKYMYANLGITFVEGMYASITSTAANLMQTFKDPEWAYGSNGKLARDADMFNQLRASVLKGTSDTLLNPDLLTSMSASVSPSEAERLVNERYYKTAEEAIEKIGSMQNWLDKNVVDNISNMLTFDLKHYGDEQYGDSQFYNAILGTSESIGNILAIWALGHLAKSGKLTNPSTAKAVAGTTDAVSQFVIGGTFSQVGAALGMSAEAVQALTSVTFASSIFGRSFQEAMDKGSDIQDAYTYALGIAAVETMTENIGGFKTTGPDLMTAETSIYTKLLGQKWGDVIANSFEEGFEEVVAEYAETGFEYYGGGAHAVTPQTNAEFYSRVLFSFLGGALSSMGLGIGNDIYLNTTLIGKEANVTDDFNRMVKEGKEQKAINYLKSDLNALVEVLNKKNTPGLKFNDKGMSYIGTLTLEEKNDFLEATGLAGLFIEEDGVFALNDKAKNVNADIFKNTRITTKTADGKPTFEEVVIKNEQYAVNKATRSVDISDNGTIDVVETKHLTETGKQALKFADALKTPIGIVDMDNKTTTGLYGKTNGVIYINQRALDGKNDAEIREIILKHEMVHHIQEKNPKLYDDIAKMVNKFIKLGLKADKTLDIQYLNKDVEDFLTSKGYDKNIKASFIDYMKQTNDDFEASFMALNKEIVPYFIENIIDGGNFINLISNNQLGILKKFQQEIEQNRILKDIAGKNRKVFRQLKNISAEFAEATEVTIKQRKTLRFFARELFGPKFEYQSLFNEEFLNQYDLRTLVLALANVDPNTLEITIEDKKYPLSQVLKNFDIIHQKRTVDDIENMMTKFAFEPERIKYYKEAIKMYQEKNDVINNPNEIKLCVTLMDNLTDVKNIYDPHFDSEADQKELLRVLTTAMLEYEEAKEQKAKTEAPKRIFVKTPEFDVALNAVAKIVKYLKKQKISGYDNWKNGAKNTHFVNECAYLVMDKNEEFVANYTKILAVAISVNPSFYSKPNVCDYSITYKMFSADENFKSGHAEVYITPTKEYIASEVVRVRERKEELASLREQEEQAKINGISYKDRRLYNKYYTEKSLATEFVGTIKRILAQAGINLENMNVIESSAGNGSFIDVFKQANIGSIEAYDLVPERVDIQAQDFLKLQKPFDKNNIVISNPPFAQDTIIDFIKHSFTMAPAVAFILPMTWAGSYQSQRDVPNDKKLIYNERMGIKSFRMGDKTAGVKICAQIWVNKNDTRFANFEDLRLPQDKPSTHNDFDTLVIRDEESYKEAKGYKFDFAVFSRGRENYKNQFVAYDELRESGKGRYVLIKAYSEDALNILKSLDYEYLAKNGSTSRLGFNVYDLVEAYENAQKASGNATVSTLGPTFTKHVVATDELTQEDIERLKSIAPDTFVLKSLRKDKHGNYVLKNADLSRATSEKDQIQINRKIYNASEYAVHAYVDVSDENFYCHTSGFVEPLKHREMTADEKQLYAFLSSTTQNFVMYNSRRLVDASGFSLPYSLDKTNVLFINTYFLNGPGDWFDVFVHETAHEIFKFSPEQISLLAPIYADLFFKEENGVYVGNILWDQVQSHFGSNFINYMHRNYNSSIKDINELYSVLKKADSYSKSISTQMFLDELLAQLTGVIFSDTNVYKHIYGSQSNSGSMAIFQVFSTIMNLSNQLVDPHIKNLFMDAFDWFDKSYKEYIQKIKKAFPGKSLYTQADLNDFIKKFTDGKFTTKIGLFNQYLKEKSKHHRGEATIAIDNIIYVGSTFAKEMQQAVSAFQLLKDEFIQFKETIEFILDSETSFFALANSAGDGDIFMKYKYIITNLKRIKKQKISDVDLYELERTLRSFRETYHEIDEKLIKALGLNPEFNVELATQKLETAIKFLINNPFTTTFSLLGMAIDEFLLNTNTVYQARKVFIDKNTENVYAKILYLQKLYRDTKIDNIVNTLTSRFQKTVKDLKNQPRQKESPIADRIIEVINIIEYIIKTIHSNKYSDIKMKAEIVPLLEALMKRIDHTTIERDGEKVPYFSDEQKALLIKQMKVIYAQIAALVKDQLVLQLAFPDDIGIQSLKASQTVKFNANTLAGAFSSFLQAFQTRYTTVFNDEYDDNEYADITNKQISRIETPLNTMLCKLSDIMPIQEFMLVYRTLTKGKLDFFEDFWREYTTATKKRTDMLEIFDKEYRNFNKKHPELQKYSEEEVNISAKHLIQMRDSTLQDLKVETDNEIAAFNKQKAEQEEKLEQVNAKIKANEIHLDALSGFLNSADSSDPQYAGYSKQFEKLTKEQIQLVQDMTDIGKQIQAIIDERDIETRDARLKRKILTWTAAHPGKQTMTHGEIINLYMSVEREIQMYQLVTGGATNIMPTNHIDFANQIWIVNSKEARKHGHEYAKSHATPFTIFSNNKEDLRDYIKSELLTENDQKIIDFVIECLNRNYDVINAVFRAKFKVDLPRQSWYIPFATLDSDFAREFKLAFAATYNVGVADGLVTSTTIGARTALRMSNIFSVLEYATQSAANYQYERLITDFQNLLVNHSGGSSLQAQLQGEGGKFGTENNIIRAIERTFVNILRYNDVDEPGAIKFVNKTLRNIVSATTAVNIPMMIRQLASTTTIAIRFHMDIAKMIENIMLSFGRSKYRRWLMAGSNNSNFYFRKRMGGNPNLSESINPDLYNILQDRFLKVSMFLSKGVAWLDDAVLVGTFKTICDKIRNEANAAGQPMTEEEVMQKANETLNEVLLFGVANTDPAYRSNFSNSRNIGVKIASKFQSENVLQTSGIIRALILMQNKINGSSRVFLRNILGMLISALFSALVQSAADKTRGTFDEEDPLFDLMVNNFLWQNMVGALPYINQLSSAVSFSTKGIETGFPARIPLVSDVENIIRVISTMQNGENLERKVLKIMEYTGTILGLPLKNTVRLATTTSRLFSEAGIKNAIEVKDFFTSTSAAVGLATAVKNNDRAQINIYVSDQYDNLRVQTEITNLLAKNPDAKLSIYNVDSFKTKNEDGTYTKHSIPPAVNDKYKTLTQKALYQLINNAEYRKLKSAEKIKVIQRVINYYYNHMKNTILGGKIALKSFSEVLAGAIQYAN